MPCQPRLIERKPLACPGPTSTIAPREPPLVFSSTLFLLLFLPVTLGLCLASPARLRNGLLLLASLLYYAWGESRFLPIVVTSVVLNHIFGLLAERFEGPSSRRAVIALAVAFNLGLLGYFKYATFFATSVNQAAAAVFHVGPLLSVRPIELPLGISFFTFHALSYVIDIHRRQVPAQRNLSLLALYVLFFPQLVAGPIVRYHEICDQLTHRQISVEGLSYGVQRFIVGLAKKMLIANSVAGIADGIFALPTNQLTAPLAWLGAIAYALQIYFDFSGYSDMAIGLASMFGFRFPENFNHPYVAQSITNFWRRWHMSLSRWFRDYLYIPLGGNRVGTRRVYFNLIVVFLLCGLWHGASWNFVVWGLLHGLFLVIERMGLAGLLQQRAWWPLRHAYCLIVIVVTWVFFRAPTLPAALGMLRAMFGAGHTSGFVEQPAIFLDHQGVLALVAGVVGSTPWLRVLAQRRATATRSSSTAAWEMGRVLALTALLVASAMRLSSGTYNPFIYFRF